MHKPFQITLTAGSLGLTLHPTSVVIFGYKHSDINDTIALLTAVAPYICVLAEDDRDMQY